MSALFVDLERAFVSTSHEGVTYKLASTGVIVAILAWDGDFLSDLSFQVEVGPSKSSSHPLRRDMPHGSVLRPMRFNVLMSDLQALHHSPPHVCCWHPHHKHKHSSTLAESQQHLKEAATALAALGLTVRPQKSALTFFTLRRLPAPHSVL